VSRRLRGRADRVGHHLLPFPLPLSLMLGRRRQVEAVGHDDRRPVERRLGEWGRAPGDEDPQQLVVEAHWRHSDVGGAREDRQLGRDPMPVRQVLPDQRRGREELARQVVLQMAEVAVTRDAFAQILSRIRHLKPVPT